MADWCLLAHDWNWNVVDEVSKWEWCLVEDAFVEASYGCCGGLRIKGATPRVFCVFPFLFISCFWMNRFPFLCHIGGEGRVNHGRLGGI